MLLTSNHRWWRNRSVKRRLFPIAGCSSLLYRPFSVCQVNIIPRYWRPQGYRYHGGNPPHALFRDGAQLRPKFVNKMGASIIKLAEIERRARSLSKSVSDLEALQASYEAQELSERERYEEQCIDIIASRDWDDHLEEMMEQAEFDRSLQYMHIS
jgi:hypothetical protein